MALAQVLGDLRQAADDAQYLCRVETRVPEKVRVDASGCWQRALNRRKLDGQGASAVAEAGPGYAKDHRRLGNQAARAGDLYSGNWACP